MDIKSITVNPGTFDKELLVPTSKSYANRLLILAALIPDEVILKSMPKAMDVVHLIDCLKNIGVKIEGVEKLRVLNSFPECEKVDKNLVLTPGEGGTTTRFLIALLAKGKNKYRVEISNEMSKRPMTELLDSLKALGVSIGQGDDFIEVQGPYKINDEILVDGSRSTQFASALALAGQKVKMKDARHSLSYFDLTNSLIKKIKEGQREFAIPTDFSSLSYPLGMGVTNGSVKVLNFTGFDELQADAKLLNILKENIKTGIGNLETLGCNFNTPLNLDCSDCLDLVPTLAYLCSTTQGKSYLKNLKGLTYKETNRLLEISKILKMFSIEHKIENFSLEITGTSKKAEFVKYNSPQDHRMAMMAFMFMKKNSGGIINNFDCVDKSFPGFFELMA